MNNSFLPMNEVVLNAGLDIFSKVSVLVTAFLSVIFVMRVAYLVLKVARASDYADLVTDSVQFMAIMSLFPIILKLIVFGANDLAQKISYIPSTDSQKSIQNFLERLFFESPYLLVFGKIGDLIVFGIASSIYSISMTVLIATAPIFLFLGTMLNLQSGLKAYFGLLICLSLWPVIWNILGHLSTVLAGQILDSPVTSVCFYFVVQILQLLSPIFTFSLFRSMSLDSGAGKVLSSVGAVWR